MSATNTRTEEPSTTHFSLKRLAPLTITVLAGLLCYGLFYNRGAWLSVIGYSVSPAERVLQGEVPYRDFLYNYTPGILWLNALLMRLFGANLMAIHLGLLAFKLAALIALYVTGRRLLGDWAALTPVALALSWIGYQYIFGVFPTQYSMVFIFLGIICMLRHNEKGSHRWLFASGVSFGLVFLFKYNAGILLFGCASLAVTIRQLAILNGPIARRLIAALKTSIFFWAGFAVALAPLVLYLVATDALRAMLDHFIHHVSAYGDERKVPLPPLKQLLPVASGLVIVLAGAWLVLRKAPKYFQAFLTLIFLLAAIPLLIPGRAYVIKNSAMATVAYLPFFLLAGIAVFSIWQLRRGVGEKGSEGEGEKGRKGEGEMGSEGELLSSPSDSSSTLPLSPTPLLPFSPSPLLPHSPTSAWWGRNGATIIVALLAMGTYLEIYPRADYYHVVRALPPTLLLMVLLIARCLPSVRDYLGRFTAAPRREALLCAALPVVLLMIVGLTNTWQPNFDGRGRLKNRAPLEIERGQGILVPPKQAEFIKELTDMIQTNSGPDDSIFSFGQRGAGFYFLAGRKNPTRFVWWRNVGIRREDRESALRMVSEKQAKLILLQDSLQDRRIREIVNTNYHVVGWINGIAVYDRNN